MTTGKKLLSSILAAVLTAISAAGAFPVLPAPVYAETADEFYYRKSDDQSYVIINGCESGMTVIDIPAEIDGLPVREISSLAFSQNKEITSVSMPDTVTKIGKDAFYQCTGLETVRLSEGLSDIAEYMFLQCESLTEIEIPANVTRIGNSAFSKCSSLTRITFREGLRSIGSFAFEGCTSLTNFTLPDTLETLGAAAFEGCKSLTSLRIPPLISELDNQVFNGCTALSDVTFAGEIRSISANTFWNAAFLAEQTGLKYAGNWLILADPDITEADIAPGTIGIADNAFKDCTSLQSASFPDSLKYIGRCAFYNTALQTVNTDHTITSIGDSAFGQTPLLMSQTEPLRYFGNVLIDADMELTEAAPKEGTVAIADGVFQSHTALKSIRLPDSLTVIGKAAFEESGLTGIIIPEGVTVIPEDAFMKCQSLSSVVLPDTLTEIGFRAFTVCTSLRHIEFPASLTKIGQQAFCSCVQIKAFEIPASVADIDMMALGYKWDDLTYGAAVNDTGAAIFGYAGSAAEAYASEYNVAFFDLNSLSGSCGDSVYWSFDYKNGALSLTGSGDMNSFDENTEVPWDALRSRILTVSISPDITSLCDYAFSGCSALKSLTLPDSVSQIGINPFFGCTALSELTLSASLPAVSGDILSECTALRSVSVGAGSPAMYSDHGVLYSADKKTLLFVPPAYESNAFAVPDSVTEIAAYAFYNSALPAVTVPDSVTKIGSCAFYGAASIETLLLPAGLKQLGSYSLYGCASLTQLLFRGDAPTVTGNLFDISGYSAMPPVTVYCRFDGAGWDTLMQTLELPADSEWVDLSGTDANAGLTLNASALTLEAGKDAVLTASISPMLALDVQFRSDDPHVATVSADGTVTALHAGKCTITASAANGEYTAACTVTVTGDAALAKGITELPDQLIRFDSVSDECRQIVCAERYGLYLLDSQALRFYSLLTGSVEELMPLSSLQSSFVQGDLLYLLQNDSKVTVYDLASQQKTGGFVAAGFTASAVGADAKGRIYLAGTDTAANTEIRLYSADGTLLSSALVSNTVSAFGGFDATNGNFYFECDYNQYLRGSFRNMIALRAGRVTGDAISVVNENIDRHTDHMISGAISEVFAQLFSGTNEIMLCQRNFSQHKYCTEMINGKYLAIFMNCYGLAVITDSNSYDPDELFFRYAASFPRSNSDEVRQTDWIGTLTVYDETTESVIGYTGGNVLEQRCLGSGKLLAAFTAAHPVFSLLKLGSDLLILEKEDDVFYLETVSWKIPDSVSVSAERDTLPVGSQMQLSASADSAAEITFDWSSSDPTVASVNRDGTVTAWKEGTVEITVTAFGAVSGAITLTVTPRTLPEDAAAAGKVIGTGSVSSNAGKNRYPGNFADTVKSYLHMTDSGELERIEYIGSVLTVERFSANGSTLISSRTLTPAQDIFGGVFTGSKYNFVISGSKNPEESDDVPVITVEKYSKDWTLLDAAPVTGVNTSIPFDAGSLRMAESGSLLYIHTCHEMYEGDDGLHHQANMTFVFDQETMLLTDSNYDVSNTTTGYVSHSFNQFVRVEDGCVYRADHGDAEPRGVAVSRVPVGSSITAPKHINSYPFSGDIGDNATGVDIGGFEVSDTDCLTAISSVQMTDEEFSPRGQRNIFVVITDKSMRGMRLLPVTDYTDDDGITPYTPQLVKFGANAFLLMWEEADIANSITTKMVTLDGEGTVTSKIVSTDIRLSDCQPFADENGMVHWYVTEQSAPVFYTVDPYDLRDTVEQRTLDYSFDAETGTLVISGTGTMKKGAQPWSIYADSTKHLIVEEGVPNIAAYAFADFTALEDISLPYSVRKLGSCAFSGCTALQQIDLPMDLWDIPSGLFQGCVSLKTVKMSFCVQSIGAEAFASCSGMTDLYLSGGLLRVDSNAFRDCSSLADIWYEGFLCDFEKINISEEGNDAIWQAALHTLDDTEIITPPDPPHESSGDVNGDGVIELADAVMLYRLLAEEDMDSVNAETFLQADVDDDGILTIRDAAQLLSFLKLVSSLH